MIEPKAPRPRQVYLRRRIMALAGAVVAVFALAWGLTLLIGRGEPEVGAAGAPEPAAPPPTESSTPAPSTSGSAAPGSSTPPPSEPPPSEPPSEPPPASPPPPDPKEPCPDGTTAVTAELTAPSFRVGQRPGLRLVVTNNGPACTRDVGRGQRELAVTTAAGERVWSINDCSAAEGSKPRVLLTGERLTFDVTWAARTSAPGCPTNRSPVPAGDYRLFPRLGKIIGAPAPFTVAP
ncbi:hypothetical protein ACOBQX_18885 [Actinokineospora sp. G85]|uniref:hypothetical protein n=1 Tax=Actinokineospora sp. G85 TaxID=3406626 RepID=UPI003C746B28